MLKLNRGGKKELPLKQKLRKRKRKKRTQLGMIVLTKELQKIEAKYCK